ncbi:YjfK family protein [Thalassotalea litorea]|uniref:YjfK family protein n=1 Tax=Thalassotalea litorea TaxID=2020715 RepID=UPI003736C14A
MFNWFKKKNPKIEDKAPEILGLRLGGAFDLDTVKMTFIEPELIIDGAANTQFIEAVGLVQLDPQTTVLRYYTDDEGYIQILVRGELKDENVEDVKLMYFYETKGIANGRDWNNALERDISRPELYLQGHTFQRVWQTSGDTSPPVAMTEKTYAKDGTISETDQFAMLYERQFGPEKFEYAMLIGEEKIINNQHDRYLVTVTGFDLQPSDIYII